MIGALDATIFTIQVGTKPLMSVWLIIIKWVSFGPTSFIKYPVKLSAQMIPFIGGAFLLVEFSNANT